MGSSTLGDRRGQARAGLALVVANARYWTSVAHVVRGELRRWERHAEAIEDPELRALALAKLHGEGLHAEAAAMCATLAPRAHRRDAVEAIVALELLYDYLDGLTERPCPDPLREGRRLFAAYTDALAAGSQSSGEEPGSELDDHAHREAPHARDAGDGDREGPRLQDGGYLQALSGAVRVALTRLPAAGAVAALARANAARSAQAQIRMHAASRLGAAQVKEWARSEIDGTGLQWRELLAGAASSVLAVHALIAAAADPGTTPAQAAEIETAYLRTCVVLTLLDGLVDHEQDTRAGGAQDASRPGAAGGLGRPGGFGYIGFYEDRDELSRTLADAVQRAAGHARALRNGPHHAMTLVGVVAYYASDPGARTGYAQPIFARLQKQLRPLIFPTLALMRCWRLAKRIGDRRAPRGGGLASYTGQSHRGYGGSHGI